MEHGECGETVRACNLEMGQWTRRPGWLWIGIGARSEQPNGSRLPCRSPLMDPVLVVVNLFFRQTS